MKKLHPFEIVWYTTNGLLGLWGLTYLVLGIICKYLRNDNPLNQANQAIKNTFGLPFFDWGCILLAIAVILIAIVLLCFALKTDTQTEKINKRAARMARIQDLEKNINKDETIVVK